MLKKNSELKKKLIGIALIIILSSYFVKGKMERIHRFVNSIFIPVQSIFYKTSQDIKDKNDLLKNFKETQNQIQEEKRKVLILETKLYEYENIKKENERLKSLLELRNESNNYIATRIVFRHIYDIYGSFTIDKGRNHGILENMVVISGNNLVGRVVKSEENYSIVRTINNPNVMISAMDKREDVGIVRGSEENVEVLRYTPGIFKEQLEIGEIIYTSGISDIYPKGLIIGVITDKFQETDSFVVKPQLDISKIREVIVIKKGD